jgi:penicillin-binding protein 1A
VRGPVAEPNALVVEQHLDFEPPVRPIAQIERLEGPFVHHATAFDGRDVAIAVSPESPDFVPLDDVPPLFVRTLLLGEDANFFGHRGLDFAELPSAIATNLARGTFARGASTITQQLAKNLFLSREKKLGRKLAEAALALLLDATLGKHRVLEIYVNVIEWGPGLYGLRPAARHYFGREPAALTPKQMAFLVAMIPGPVKYQRSIPDGVPTAFFEGLIGNLLSKLHATGALDDAAFDAALVEPLGLVTAEAEGPPRPAEPAVGDGAPGAGSALTAPATTASLPPTGTR